MGQQTSENPVYQVQPVFHEMQVKIKVKIVGKRREDTSPTDWHMSISVLCVCLQNNL